MWVEGGGGGGGDIAAAVTEAAEVAVCGVASERGREREREAKRGPQHPGAPGPGLVNTATESLVFLSTGRQQWAPKKQKTKDGLFISVHCSRGGAVAHRGVELARTRG